MTTEDRLSASLARVSRVSVACLLALAVALPPGVEQAVVRADDGLPPPAPRSVEEIDVAPPGADLAEAAPPFEHTQATASLLAYQSFQDGNWEIYLTVNDTGATRRLTADPASDLEPKISPDLTRVLFTSRRTGNYDLFRVNVDGTGLVQLTNAAATDSAATWSPDGTRLAFQSQRTGNDDIFVMNADGSGLTQLTDNRDYDGEPAWSPDGKEIAFISRRSSGNQSYFLYVMNADGSGQRVLAANAYSSRPAWSYSGKRILYDAFDPANGQRLYVYDFANGSVRATGHFPLSTYRYSDVMAGSWGLGDDAYVTLATYAPANGQWVLQNLEMWRIDVSQYWTPVRVGPGLSGFPSWQNPDHQPPVTTPGFVTRPARAWANAEVQVAAVDRGVAGIASIEVQGRRSPVEEWQNIQSQCLAVTATTWDCFVYTTDRTFQVRTRGIDAYGNRETWSDDPLRWSSTDLYYRQVVGTVLDVRGTPLANVPVTGMPNQIEASAVTNQSGAWLASQREGDPSYTLTATLPNATASLRADRLDATNLDRVLRGDFILIASDNAITNSGFETPGSGWAPQNVVQPKWIDSEAEKTHSAFLRLGGDVVRTSLIGLLSKKPVILRTGQTTLIGYDDYGQVIIRACPAGLPCNTLSSFYGFFYDLGSAPDGSLGVLYMASAAGRVFQRRSPDGVWSPTEPVPFTALEGHHRLLADSAGRWHFIWIDGVNAFISHRADGGGWSSAESLGTMTQGLDAAFDSSDTLRVINCSSEGLLQRTWSVWTGVSAPTPITAELCEQNEASLLIDEAGNAYAVWVGGGQFRYSRRPPSGSWSAPVSLVGATPGLVGVVPGTAGRPRVAVVSAPDRLTLAEVNAAGDWTPLNVKTLIASAAGNMGRFLTSDLMAGTLYVFEDSPNYLGYVRDVNVYPLVEGNGDLGVSQVISVPANLIAPTLFARYRFTSDHAGDALEIRIQAGDAVTPTILALPAQATRVWTTQWFDAAAWAGKTITVTLALHDGGGMLSPADIDVVALASWTTPIVSGVSPTNLGGAGDVFTITGDRFEATPIVLVGGHAAPVTLIDAQHLSVTLPAEHGVGAQSVIVINPGGFAAQAAQTVYVGSDRLTLPILLRWAP